MASQLFRCGVAGSAPATLFFRLGLVGALVAALVSASPGVYAKQAKLDPETREEMRKRGEMTNVHKRTLFAEQNLARGIEDRDIPRIALVLDYLHYSVLSRAKDNEDLEKGGYGAAQYLGALANSAGMLIDAKSMTVEIDKDTSISLRPPAETMTKWYEEGYSKFVENISSCEETMNFRKSQRVLPEKPPQVK